MLYMYINRRQTLLIFSILYTLLCSWLKPPLVTLRSVPICTTFVLKGLQAAHLQHRVEVSGKG